jgi:methylenetetrahydrofolate reductase (NADPH)
VSQAGDTPTVAGLLARPRFEIVPLRSGAEEWPFLPTGGVVTVTCSPNRGVDVTLDLAEQLAGRGLNVVPHLAARTIRSREHLVEVLDRVRRAGVDDVFVVGGDGRDPAGPYESAGQLLAAMTDVGHGIQNVGVGGYPDAHPFIDRDRLMEALLAKQPMATYMVTQMCFDAGTIAQWLGEARGRGVALPAHLGVPGVLKRRKLLEISLRVGVGDSARYITKHAGIVARLIRRGDYRPDALLGSLAGVVSDPANGVAGLHINTFNQIRATERWRQETLQAYGWAAMDDDADDEGETAS